MLDPYAIWISEIMLQQTQVKTVIPYFERWMHELPDVRVLADAPQNRVLKLWEGLGYYTRARNLQQAAQQIVREHDGRFPREFEALLALPGIGRYTAGAIASIAFNQPAPILDGNVIRVLTRLFAIRDNPREKTTSARLWEQAASLVATAGALRIKNYQLRAPMLLAGRCSALNQALMELGATICTPRQPHCALCPCRSHCVARAEGLVDQLPNLTARATATSRRFVAFVTERGGRVLVRQRPGGVVNAHLWEFPNAEVSNGTTAIPELLREHLGFTTGFTTPLCTIKHSITRYRITLEAVLVKAVGGRASAAPGGVPASGSSGTATPTGKRRIGARRSNVGSWVAIGKLDHLAFTSAHRKVLRAFLAQAPQLPT